MKTTKHKAILIYMLFATIVFAGSFFVFLNTDFENLKILDKEFYLNSEERRLELFYEWMREEPVFYFSTLDIENYRESVSRLKNEEEEFLEMFNWESNVFPVSFLFAVASTSENYLLFERDKTLDRALVFLNSLEESVTYYEKEARSLKEILPRVLDDIYRVSIGGKAFTTKDIAISDLDKILANADFVRKEIEGRKKCLTKSSIYCKKDFSNDLKFVETENKDWELLDDKDIFELYFKEMSGPYEINSLCWGEESSLLYTEEDCPAHLDYCMQISRPATELYLRRIQPVDEYYQYLMDMGAEVISDRATNAYVCSDLEFKPKISTINYFFNKYKDSLIFGDEAIDFYGLEIRGRELERDFFMSDYPSEDSFENLASFYKYAHKEIKKNNPDSQILSSLEERYKIMSEKIVNFDKVVNSVANNFFSLKIRYSKIDPVQVSEYYVYSSRSNYSLFFFAFSPAFWRLDEKLTFHITDPEKDFPNKDDQIYTKLPKEEREEVKKGLKIFQDNNKQLFLIENYLD